MLRNSFVLLFLMLFISILPLGCTSPEDPTDSAVDGNTQPEDDPPGQTTTTGVGLGEAAPDFTLPNTYGDNVVLNDLRGEPVLMYFWATWCSYCVAQSPRIQEFHETFSDSMTVMSINLGENPQMVNAYLADHGYTFPTLVADNAMLNAYEISGVPHAMVLDAEGVVTFNNHPAYLSEVAIQEEF